MTFAEKLRKLRKDSGMTQEQLADASGMPISTLRDYEQGLRRRDPSLGTALRLARALGKSLEVFADCLQDEGSPTTKKKRSKK